MNIFVHLFCMTSTYNIYICFCYIITKWPKRGNIFRKTKSNLFLLCQSLNQHRQLTNGRNFCSAVFWLGATHKVRTLRQTNFFWFWLSLVCIFFFLNGVIKTIDHAFGQISPLPLPLTHMRTLSIDVNLKMLAV